MKEILLFAPPVIMVVLLVSASCALAAELPSGMAWERMPQILERSSEISRTVISPRCRPSIRACSMISRETDSAVARSAFGLAKHRINIQIICINMQSCLAKDISRRKAQFPHQFSQNWIHGCPALCC